ncbi:hypothetical protein [Adhaeribacter rhizoryzae]|uniref:Uncharacterized protein n=1 Tax=Adhaeribacter rhizoryzae TaxID=2607907 RepID=A0A5M6CW09_9BACT|nr:hypothetical protein [Adhaeribacter rhizoryzae]KAA5539136.1 hypothetical protein F0145_25035 [Adhaeribacter rhizoryzae]
MSKDLLNKIRGALENNEAPDVVTPADDKAAVQPVAITKPTPASRSADKAKATSKKKLTGQQAPGFSSLAELQQLLKAEKEGFSFNRRLVYIDDNIGEALDLLRKEAKINSNVLASYLLKQFLLQHKELIKVLREKKRDNLFFD